MDRVRIESLDLEGRGVAHVEGKAVFIEGALPGELVEFAVLRRRPSYELGRLVRVIRPSSQRAAPRCPHFGVCGGCALQHFEPAAQVAAKQRVLEDALWHIGRLRAERLLAPIHGPYWGYRSRARIGVRLVPKKGGVLVGFRERKSSYIADMTRCEILPPHVSALLPVLRALIGELSCPDRIPQIEVAVGDDGTTVLVFRHLVPLLPTDREALAAFGERHGVQVWLQPGGPDSIVPLFIGEGRPLAYRLPEFGLTLFFAPTDFTQVNVAVNRLLVRRAIDLLEPRPGERIADFFCGLGNFSLPIARRGAQVLGIEGSEALMARALENAQKNGLAERCRFDAANLFTVTPDSLAALGAFDKWLVDPPRDGAIELVKAIDPVHGPRRIVYVSCNPATLARDAAVLVHEKGYRLESAGVANMFPHTAHVESIARFERAG